MINLVHPTGYKIAKREYWVRVVSVWAFLLTGVFVIFALLLLPSYVLVQSQINTVRASQSVDQDVDVSYKTAEAIVQEANEHIKQLKQEDVRTEVSEVITTVSNLRTAGIEIKRYEIKREDGSLNTFVVQGKATTRDKLAEFRSDLERAALFEKVELPISDLARSTDLPFVMTVSVAPIKRESEHE